MKIFEIAQWDTWSRSFGEIVSIFLIFGSGWHCHLSFLDQRFLCLMLYIYFKSQYAPKPVTRRNVTKEHSTHNFGEYEHYKILMVTGFGTFWLNFMNNIIHTLTIFSRQFFFFISERKNCFGKRKDPIKRVHINQMSNFSLCKFKDEKLMTNQIRSPVRKNLPRHLLEEPSTLSDKYWVVVFL